MAPSAALSEIRKVPFGSARDDSIGGRFCDNIVTTSKYTVLSFLPLNLRSQLQKMANVYFLLISIAMQIAESTSLYVESIKAYSTALTLFMMMAWSALMAAIDDYHRHKADNAMNSQPAHVIIIGGTKGVDGDTIEWKEVKVGDLLIVRADNEFPADMVPLACSGDEGTCYVSTANLDGETNLKIKSAVPSTQAHLCGVTQGMDAQTTLSNHDTSSTLLDQVFKKLETLGGTISAEAPQQSIHTFNGSIISAEGVEEPLSANTMLLRGTMLRNTAWCIGVVVYTGSHTRVVMNSRKTPLKLANLENVINLTMIVVLCTQLLLAIISDIAYNVDKSKFKGYSYLTVADIDLPDVIGFALTFFILYSNLMPISLYATMEVCNSVQGYLMKNDLEIYDDETDSPAIVRSTNLSQELGQVEYIFSDKTGTLTQNVMELKRVSIAGKLFGQTGEERGFHGDKAIDEARASDPATAQAIDDFLEVLSVSHTVVVDEDKDGAKKYEAESPDEGALVETAGQLGWTFVGRTGQAMALNVKMGGKSESRKYTCFALNAFNSTRKRMSVIVQRPSGEYMLLVKGADNVMLERSTDPAATLQAHLGEMSMEGLRTLVIGRRMLSKEEYTSWMATYNQAVCAINDRDGALSAAAEKIEVNLELVGATGIEDKLQVGVGQTIVKIRAAGIKLWVLTGDKLETARNIGFSTRVLSDDMDIPILDSEAGGGQAAIKAQLAELLPRVQQSVNKGVVVGMMVTGSALTEVTENGMEPFFLEIGKLCSVVIACRVSPLQKAQMVALVRKGIKPQPVTLAVGDGANDVPMIQEAQVGVGIVGKEGRQAVNAADFAIGQFRFLQRLLLVHGRWNYRRTCKLTLYTFWRNAVQVLLMFYFSFLCGQSGTTIFEDKTRMTFNFILSIPIIATGCFDRDVADTVVLENPILYETGRVGLDLNPKVMLATLVSAMAHSLVILLVLLLAFPGMSMLGVGDVYTWGTALYSVLIMDSNYRVAFLTITWNKISVAFLVFSYGLYLLFCFVYGVITFGTPVMKQVTYHMGGNAPFWICLCAVPAISMTIDLVFAFLQLRFFPDTKDRVLEIIKEGKAFQVQAIVPPLPKPGTPTSSNLAPPLPKMDEDGKVVKTDSRSSFMFDHPEGAMRNHAMLGVSHPLAGDTSAMDKLISEGGPQKKAPKTPTKSQKPVATEFSQQKLPSFQLVLTPRKIAAGMFLAGVVVVVMGVSSLMLSQSAAQLRIHYSGDFQGWPSGTKEEETYKVACAVGSVCSYTVTPAEDMEPPIWVFYSLDPFYQNYNSWMQSVAKQFKDMKPIASTFTDSFDIAGMKGSIDDIAWESDMDRFECSKGSACTNDVVWTRPSAMPLVQKPVMTLSGKTLKKGQNYTITINATTDSSKYGARKELVLTTLSGLGGRDDSLGLFLIICGAICLLCSGMVLAMHAFNPRKIKETTV